MKKLYLLLIACLSVNFLQAQTLGELKDKKAEIEEMRSAKQGEADAFQGEIDALQKEIDILSGWQTGLDGLVGLNLGGSNKWASNANPNNRFSNFNIGANAFANKIQEKTFWRNNLTANVGWQGLDNNTLADGGTSFLGDRNTDVLLGSSLYGFRLNQDIAISLAGDFASSVFNFLNPGSLDLGAGITWTPHQVPNLAVVIHPLTYHIAWAKGEQTETLTAVGAKLKATYSHEFPGGIVWSSNLAAFIPYSNKEFAIKQYYAKGEPLLDANGVQIIQDKNQNIIPPNIDPIPRSNCPCANKRADGGENKLTTDGSGTQQIVQAGLFEYTWINSLNIADIWKGVGLGVTFGIRKAEFENADLQTYNAIGLTYGF